MILLYDIECFKYDWLVCVLDPYTGTFTDISNDRWKLQAFYNKHKDDVWVSYNGRHYDKWIIKGILGGYDAYQINDFIINKRRNGWEFNSDLNKIPLYDYDAYQLNDGSLKGLESNMGLNIHETDVDFNIDRKLTEEEMNLTIGYCHDDVLALMNVFIERKADFDAHMGLINTFKLPLSYISKTPVQLAAKILECDWRDHDDEFDVDFVPTLQLDKYAYVKEWFIQKFQKCKEAGEYVKGGYLTTVAGTPTVFGFGGIHGCINKLHAKGLLVHVDVTSFYPTLSIVYNFLTRNSTQPQKYKEIYDTRVALKKAGKKKEQMSYKLVLNGSYGISKDKLSIAHDGKMGNCICVNGQLLLLMLIERLEKAFGTDIAFVNINTDGLIVQIPDTDKAWDLLDDICYGWEKDCKVSLEFDIISELWQKDVNNYIFQFANGKLERKGKWVQESTRLKNELTIVNTALVEYMTNNVPVEKTILECNDPALFMMTCKVSNKYECGFHNGERLTDKVFRVYASKNQKDDSLYKKKSNSDTKEKFGDVPDHLVIYNGALGGVTCDDIGIDKNWYVELAKKRLSVFYKD